MRRNNQKVFPEQAPGLNHLRIRGSAGINLVLRDRIKTILTMLISKVFTAKAWWKPLLLLQLLAAISACSTDVGVYKAYVGTPRAELQVAQIDGAHFMRTDWINRYLDVVRFLTVDGIQIDNPEEFDSIQVNPGYHDFKVYFSWDTGSQRGLAPALVNYAANSATMSRTLRFNALSGERYIVRAEPVFNSERREITDLLYVDFWIEDREGNEIVTRESGRYLPQSVSR